MMVTRQRNILNKHLHILLLFFVSTYIKVTYKQMAKSKRNRSTARKKKAAAKRTEEADKIARDYRIDFLVNQVTQKAKEGHYKSPAKAPKAHKMVRVKNKSLCEKLAKVQRKTNRGKKQKIGLNSKALGKCTGKKKKGKYAYAKKYKGYKNAKYMVKHSR